MNRKDEIEVRQLVEEAKPIIQMAENMIELQLRTNSDKLIDELTEIKLKLLDARQMASKIIKDGIVIPAKHKDAPEYPLWYHSLLRSAGFLDTAISGLNKEIKENGK